MTLLSFAKLEELLPTQDFVRVYKLFLVAIGKIDYIEKNRIQIGSLIMPISDAYAKAFYNCRKGYRRRRIGSAKRALKETPIESRLAFYSCSVSNCILWEAYFWRLCSQMTFIMNSLGVEDPPLADKVVKTCYLIFSALAEPTRTQDSHN